MTVDEKRLAEIREMLVADVGLRGGFPIEDAADDLLAMLDEERDRSRRLMDERDGARGALAIRYALRRDIEEMLGVESGPASDEQLSRGVEAVKALRARAKDAERKLAALVAATVERDDANAEWCERPERIAEADRVYDAAIAGAATVAERHDREVRAKELRRLSAAAVAPGGPRGWSTPTSLSAWIEREADRIERGEV